MLEQRILVQLKKVRELISNPKRWTQGAFARDADGISVSLDDPKATCFCLSGAIHKVVPDCNFAIFLTIIAEVGEIPTFNDNHSHSEVLGALDRIIKREA